MGKTVLPFNLIYTLSFIFALWTSLLLTYTPAMAGSSLRLTSNFFLQSTGADTTRDAPPSTPSDKQAYRIKDRAGWHFIVSFGRDSKFNDLLSGFWSQGIPGSDAPAVPAGEANIYSWNEKQGTFEPIKSMEDRMLPGRGYMMHIFEDDNFNEEGIQGGFPKTIPADTASGEIRSPVMVAVRSVDENGNGAIDKSEGFNLLANPFEEAISVDEVIEALRNVNPNIDEYVYIWDPSGGGGNGSYIPLAANGSGGIIGPYQAFFVRFTADDVTGEVSLDRNDLKIDDNEANMLPPGNTAGIEIALGNDRTFDTWQITFGGDETLEEDQTDAYKLFSMNENAISLFSTSGNDIQLANKMVSDLLTLEGELRISLAYAVPDAGEYSLKWSDLAEIPQRIELQLVDRKANRSMDMRLADEYSFSVHKGENQSGIAPAKDGMVPEINHSKQAVDNSRFELLIEASDAQESGQPKQVTENVALSPNYPNPFTSQTTMDLVLEENMHVKMTVWTIVGQKVGTMADQMMSEGNHTMTWTAPANMPSGIYLCKVEAGGKVITRKMTLVK